MAPPDQLPDIPNAFVDPTAALVTLTNSNGPAFFVLPALFQSYAGHDVNLRNGRTDGPVPVGYDQFTARWNQDTACRFRFSTYDPATGAVTTFGVPFPAAFLDAIDPPVLIPYDPAPSDRYTEGQHDLIQHMLWSTARRESFFEQRREAAPSGKTPPTSANRPNHLTA
ncbi:hypothetical protein GSI_07442 [Ganoderma sinense ZZ0214-1]|uniref:Uncharacterized protein n=1 Tax=Ganoderma sinense ZZ0214-1 TaxID=1077348 RepID=A0A2G8S927_9APHY|nr:hypothetical protein GSI_07442 [Ganoderma sinense ZZ0214-1]